MTAIMSANKSKLLLRLVSVLLCLCMMTGSLAYAVEGAETTAAQQTTAAAQTTAAQQTTAAATQAAGKTAETTTDASLADLQRQYNSIERQQAANKQKLEKINSEIKQQKGVVSDISSRISKTQQEIDLYSSRITVLNSDIYLTQQQISVINGQISSLNDKIGATQEAMDDKQTELDETYEMLKQRLRAVYMAGNGSTLEFLLSSKDFSTLLTRAELVKRVAEHDNNLMEVLEDELDTLNELKDEYNTSVAEQESKRTELDKQNVALNDKKGELTDAGNQLKEKQAEIKTQYNEASAELNSLDKESDEYVAMIKEQEAEKERINRMMEEYIRTHGSSTSDQQQTQIETVTNADGTAVTNADGTAVTQAVQFTSGINPSSPNFIFPLKCGGVYISSPYGYRTHPTTGEYKLHTGTDFAAGGIYQQPIYCVQSGQVIFASWQGGYGNYIVVDHGNGLSTCYAHCDSIAVSVGQTVTQGQVIGRVGSTGNSTGPHLHFEVRINGTPTSPMAYVSL